jgi:DNA-binding CsgD family transcriptional regulator
MLQAIHVVAAGEALIDPRVTPGVIERLAGGQDSDEKDDGLTQRERDVLAAVARGLSNREIAADLHLGYGTVKTHVSQLLTKLSCRDRAQLVIRAYESGLVPRRVRAPQSEDRDEDETRARGAAPGGRQTMAYPSPHGRSVIRKDRHDPSRHHNRSPPRDTTSPGHRCRRPTHHQDRLLHPRLLPDDALPLYTPEGERACVPGWAPR